MAKAGGASGKTLEIGVLSIQGAFIEHVHMLERLKRENKELHHLEGVDEMSIVQVRKPAQLQDLDGLIIPGGESTTLSVFLSKDGFEEALRDWIFKPQEPGVVWGTCAGLILMANKLTEQKKGGQITIGGLDVECTRNCYGRQLSSFESRITLHSQTLTSDGSDPACHGVFIRAPGIAKVTSPAVKVLGTLDSTNAIVAVQQGQVMATTFHPELTDDVRWHRYFVEQVIQQWKRNTGSSVP